MARLFLFSSIILTSLLGCNRTAEVPVYLRIDDFRIETDFSTEGTASSKITTVWVEVDGEDVGAYELPVTAPIIASGNTNLRIIPGINLNGQLALRNQYEFYEPYIRNFDFIPGEEIHIKTGNNNFPVTGYNQNFADIIRLEDFEGAWVNFEPTQQSDTSLMVTQDAGEIFSEDGLDEPNEKSGKVVLRKGNSIAEFSSINAYDLPAFSQNVYLEVNYKCEIPVVFGVIVQQPNVAPFRAPVVTVLPNDEWNKIYINLVSEVSAYPNAINFKIFFGAINTDVNNNYEFFVDNLKVVY
jgi:hypothetical protein